MSTDPTRGELEAFAKRVLGANPTPKRLREWLEAPPDGGLGGGLQAVADAAMVGADLDAESLDMAAAQRKLARFTASAHRTFTTLEDAALFLLRVLDPGHADQVMDAARELQEPVWVVMLGAVVRNADLRELLAGEMSPQWRNDPGKVEATPLTVLCEQCGLKIPHAIRGQRFCCSAHGSLREAHSAGCPAAELADPRARVAPEVAPAKPALDVPEARLLLPDGFCQAEGCGVKIVNHRRGQPYCCSAHGVGHPEHSDTCVTMLALGGAAPLPDPDSDDIPIGDASDPGRE